MSFKQVVVVSNATGGTKLSAGWYLGDQFMPDEQRKPQWEIDWEQGKEKLKAILLDQYAEIADHETMRKIREAWEAGPTFNCKLRCDESNNPLDVLDTGDVIVRLHIQKPNGGIKYADASIKRVVVGDKND